MTNINLDSTGLENNSENGSVKLFSKGFIIMFLILILIIVLYFVLIFGKTYLAKQVESVGEEQKNILDNLVGNEKSKEVVDFQRRIEVARSLSEDSQNVKQYLEYFEKTIIPQAKLKNFSFDNENKIIKADLLTENYFSVAGQILSFKDSGFFTSVVGGANTFNKEENKIEFTVNLKLK